MSHFTVGIFIPKDEFTFPKLSLEELVEPYLAPFEEHESTGACDPKYLKRVDKTTENVNEYFGTHTKILVDDKLKSPWDNEFSRKATAEEIERIKSGKHELQYSEYHGEYTILGVYPKSAKEVNLPYCYDTTFPDFIIKQYSGSSNRYVDFGKEPDKDVMDYVQKISQTTELPSMKFNENYELENEAEIRAYLMQTYRVYGITNPNSKWDWYDVGGRWNDSIPLLKAQGGKQKANWAAVKNINLAPEPKRYKELIRQWEIIVEKSPLTEEEEKKKQNNPFAFSSLMKEEFFINHYGTKENYAKFGSSFSTYAFITKGKKWVGRGEMGFFGIGSDNKNSTEAYQKLFEEYMSNCDPDDKFVIVDCHI